jgi:hypothetical protein
MAATDLPVRATSYEPSNASGTVRCSWPRARARPESDGASRLSAAGHRVYALDLDGWGYSHRALSAAFRAPAPSHKSRH